MKLQVSDDAQGTFDYAMVPWPHSRLLGQGGVPIQPLVTEGLAIEVLEPEPPPEPIPSVSGWGLVILPLLLLVANKVYFGRRGFRVRGLPYQSPR